MVKRNIRFYERKKEITAKAWTLYYGKSSYYEFFGWRKRWYYEFLGVKGYLFQCRKLVEKCSLVFMKLAWYFKNRDRWSFSSQKKIKIFSVCFHVYWLLKSSCFELSGDGNTVIF